MIEVL
jgi:hypothetical protein